MAITITQKPTTPNAAYTRLVYVVSGSTNTSSPQFSYVMDVFESGSSNRITRITQTVNPAGVAVFDPSRIIQGELSEDQSWKITNAQNFSNSSKKFTLQFGEQYGTSDSSSVTVYPNSTEDVLQTFRGVVEPNDGYYDWQSGSYAVLSNMPATMSMQQNDYGTIGLYNNSVEYVSQSFYSASFTGDKLVDTKIYNVTGDFVSIPISASTPYWNYVNVEVSSSIGLQNYRYEVSNEIHREKVRFAFINKLGTWDYYNNLNPVRQTVEVNREQYTANRVDYSSLTSAYNIERRGLTDYHNTQDDSFTTQTDYLTKEDANWLEELLESPSVYIQRNNEFIPIVILNASYTANTSQARQKLFQYTIEFIPSNQPFGTWNPEFVECPRKTIEAPTVVTLSATNFVYSGSTLNGSILDSNGGAIVEKGFVYNDSGSSDPVIGGTGVTNIIVPGSQTGSFSGNTLTISSSNYYQYRAYASNSVGLTYGDTVQFNTLIGGFDPTLAGEISPNLWYDFTDPSVSVFTGSVSYGIVELNNKGTYTDPAVSSSAVLSIVTQNNPKYRGNKWIPPVMTPGLYTEFFGDYNGTNYVNSTLPQLSPNTFAPVFDGGDATFIYFAKPLYQKYTVDDPQREYQGPMISYLGSTGDGQFRRLNFLASWQHPFTGSNFDPVSFVTGSNVISSSGLQFENPRASFVVPETSSNYLISDYGTPGPTWHSYYFKFDTGSSAPYGKFGYNTTHSINITPDTVAVNTGTQYYTNSTGITFGSYARTNSTEGRSFLLSHFIAYEGLLTDAQIDRVITNFSESVSYGNEINQYSN